MPHSGKQHAGQKKNKKGRAPAHQNAFAFAHNPKSKTTDKILSYPIFHVCQRCHDKLEWRKQYRKYKPRTQPGTCNGCKRRNVKAAYHTICESCTITSEKAKVLIDQKLASIRAKDKEVEEEDLPKLRACAICVKELALRNAADEGEDDELAQATGRIRLRELKTLERQIEREAKKSNKSEEDDNGDDAVSEPDLDGDEEADHNDLESDDPLLQAVGGADKLLTGDAYQKKLLEQQSTQEN
jgi:hypothetical protein